MYFIRRFAALCCLITALIFPAAPLLAQNDQEYLVKAAFIYKFVLFAEWPGDKAVGHRSSLDICVIGDSPLLKTASVFKQASNSKLTLTLMQEKNAAAAAHCHIVFIGDIEERRLPEVLSAFKGKPILTVSDINGFADNGGMIGFVMRDDKVKLIVNTKATAEAGLRIDAQLLEVALKVIDR